MSRQQYRSELGMISDILSTIMYEGRQGTIISSIARRANLSHNAVTEKCQKLLNAGLVESANKNRNHIFFITEKGIQFFQHLQRFTEITQSIKVRF